MASTDGPSTFSSSGSCCSTPSYPSGVGHDGTSPSYTHHRDTDDEGTEDKEGDYHSNDEYVEVFGLILCILY